jgi:DNA repair protein RecO (recombination protein O)
MYSQIWTGIVLKITNYGEADRIVTVFTKEAGKVQFMARGVRKATSKYGGIIDHFVEGQFEVTRKAHLPTLIQATTITWFPYLRHSLTHWQYAERAAKAVLRATSDEDENLEVYFLLQQFLIQAEHYPNPQGLWLWFLYKLLFLTGFGISTETCQSCREELEYVAEHAQNYEGFLCSHCSSAHKEDDRLVYQYLRSLSLANAPLVESPQSERVQNFLELAFRYHLLG